ncbi:MAG: dUTP diphosphatase [Acholeplasmatales bacterium]|jgi:dUTP pyrophosphatase|nr:dUTP diphosphatase [Acholeplasmatales bacterium]
MERKFVVVKKYQDLSINIPHRQTSHSAGYDLESADNYTIKPQEIALISTGLKAYIPEGEVLLIISRSSLPRKLGLMIPNSIGVIDADYVDNPDNEGEIFILVYNFTNHLVQILKGERLAQGIFTTYLKTIPDHSYANKRVGGFGSSDQNKTKS